MLLLHLLLFARLLLSTGGKPGEIRVVYVSKTLGQTKSDSCGNESIPCKTLQLGFERLAWGGMLYVDGDQTDIDPYTCKQQSAAKKGFTIQKGFSLTSYGNSTARISCPNGIVLETPSLSVKVTGVSFVGSKQLWVKPGVNVTLKNVLFKNTVLRLKDASAVIQDCRFQESSPAIKVWITNKLPLFHLKVKNALFKKNCGCIEINQPRRAKGCNRQIVLNLQNIIFQENNILMTFKPKDEEIGLVSVKGSKNCNCDNMSFSSTWKNVTAFNNKAVVEFCQKTGEIQKSKECCWNGKENPSLFTRSIFVVHACRIYLKFSKVKSWNNINTRFLTSESRYNNISVEKSSYHGYRIDSPGGVMRIKGLGKFVKVTITDSVFFNNSGALGGVLQIDGADDKVVVLNMNNVSLLHSHGSDFGCVVSVANFSNNHESQLAYVAQITAHFDKVSLNETQFSYHKYGTNKKQHYAAFCFAASDFSKISIKKSFFYRNKVPAFILKHKTTSSSPPDSAVNVRLERTNFIENDFPRTNATVTVIVDPTVKKSSLVLLKTTFLKNKGNAVVAEKVINVRAMRLICSKNEGSCMFLESKRWPKDFDSVNSTLIIKDSVFTHNANSPIKFRHTKPKFLDIQIRNTSFHGNHYRAVLNVDIGLRKRNNSLISGKLIINRSNFTSNSVDFASTHVLTCILLVPRKAKFTVLVDKTIFQDNFQNSTKLNTNGVSSVFFFHVPEDFQIHRPQSENKRKRCKKFPNFRYNRKLFFKNVVFENNTGSSSILYINNGAHWFYRCVFKNSYARYPKSGAHVFVEEGTAKVSFFNTRFEQTKVSNYKPGKDTPFKESSLLPFVYAGARGPLLVKNTTFTLDASERKSKMFIIQNGRYVYFDTNTALSCPVGSLIKLENASHVIQPMFTRDHCRLNITRIRFVCQMCPVSTYSLQRGSFHGLHNDTPIQCLDCPFGADCEWNIRSRHNFWGYLSSTDPPRLRFTSCPENYCHEPRSKNDTSVYNKCSGNRTGLMCGACKEGFTESIFNHKCRPVNKCRDRWFWAIVVLYSVIMAIYILFQPPIVKYLFEKITWFRHKKAHDIQNQMIDEQKPNTEEHGGHGYSKIIFYFYQIADLLMIDSCSEILQKHVFIFTVISFYNFQVDMADSSFGCPFPGLTAVTKEIFRSLQVYTVMVVLVVFYFLHWLLCSIRKTPRPLFAPYIAAIIEVLLLGYEQLGHTSFNLLGCTPLKINGQVVYKMFIDGNITCWVHWWQYVLIAYNIVFVIPFLLVLLVGTRKLRRQQIGPFQFLAACFVPLPFLACWMLRRNASNRGPDCPTVGDRHQHYRKKFLEVIQGPFRPPDKQSKGALYWESILIGRRLVLLSLHSLVPTPMLRLLFMTLVCFMVLLHDVMVQPFKDRKANALAAFLLFIHVVLGSINLVKASLINAGVTPKGPPKLQLHVLELFEITLLCILPSAFLLLVAACLISQAIALMYKASLNCLKKVGLGTPRDSSEYNVDSYRPLLDPETN